MRPIPFIHIAGVLAAVLSLTMVAPPCSAADALSIDVVVLHHADFPALSEKDETATLDTAAKMIRKAIGREVAFKVAASEDYTKFIARERERIAGQRFDAFDIFEGKPADFRKEVIAACREFGTVEEVRLLLPEEDRAAAKDEAALADKLLERYAAAMDVIKGFKSKARKPVVTKESWRDFAIGDLDAIFWSMDEPPRLTLYLANTFIIDNNLQFPAPHTLVRGIAHGVAAVPAGRAIVGYQGHLSGDRRITGYPWKLSEAARKNAIAFTIAHEVGTHLILHERDDYSAGALISRPMTTTAEQLTEIDKWPKRESRERPLDMKADRYGRHMLRLRIAVARKQKAAAEKEINAMLDMEVPNEWLNPAVEIYEATKWE